MRKLNEIIVHCSATPEGKHYSVETIRNWHKQRGWKDIGYHYVIYADGTVKSGRPLEQIGAHVGGRNTGTIGICYVGGVKADGKTPKDTRTEAQKRSLVRLMKDLIKQYPSIKKISGHNQYAAKACPCFNADREYEHLTGQKRFMNTAPAAQGNERDRYLQKLLALSGNYSGQHDGIIGPKTKQGILSYQAANGLKRTGWFDDATVAELRKIEAPLSPSQKQVLADVAAEGRVSKTEVGSVLGGVSAAALGAREIAENTSGALSAIEGVIPSWAVGCLILIVAGVSVYAFVSRRKKRNAGRKAQGAA